MIHVGDIVRFFERVPHEKKISLIPVVMHEVGREAYTTYRSIVSNNVWAPVTNSARLGSTLGWISIESTGLVIDALYDNRYVVLVENRTYLVLQNHVSVLNKECEV